jgi:LPXTG-motif cell wall-anchored protein
VKLRQLTWFDVFGILLAALVVTAMLLPGAGMAQAAVTVQLDPVGASGVSGTATLTAALDGTNVTLVTLDVKGLAPGADARATMQANTCAMPSASFAALPALKADATGRATATGAVLFRGTEAVALETMADGEHVITVQTGQVVACGVIPKLAPATLPATGGAASSATAALAGVLGLCALSAGLLLRRRSQTRYP